MKLMPIAVVSALLLTAVRATAQTLQPDYPCYMQTPSGRVINLSVSICGNKAATSTVAVTRAPSTTALLAAYRSAVKHPFAQKMYDGDPERLVANAKAYCSERDSGMSNDEVVDTELSAITSHDTNVRQATLEAAVASDMLGVRYFCPQYAAGILQKSPAR